MPFPIAGAILGGAALSGLGSILGSDKQAGAAKDSARMQMEMFERLLGQQQPFVQSGYGANTRLMELLGLAPKQTSAMSYEDWQEANPEGPLSDKEKIKRMFSGGEGRRSAYDQYVQGFKPEDIQRGEDYGSLLQPFDASTFEKYMDPGYDFRLQQGTQGVMNSAAAGSGALSGAAMKDLLTFNQDMASTEYGNAFNRYQTQQGNIFQRLSGIAGMGQNAAANVGSQGTALAGGAGQAIQNAGTAMGGGIVGMGNTLGQGMTMAQLMQMMGGG